jgi:hypothetical protein
MVYDHYNEPFRRWADPLRPSETTPGIGPWMPQPIMQPAVSAEDVAELRKLIREFREALAAAKTVDRLTKQPDCEDPKKATLEDRVAALEKRLAEMGAA